jgi:hypothetical protein
MVSQLQCTWLDLLDPAARWAGDAWFAQVLARLLMDSALGVTNGPPVECFCYDMDFGFGS